MSRPESSLPHKHFRRMHAAADIFRTQMERICGALPEDEAIPLRAATQEVMSLFGQTTESLFSVVEGYDIPFKYEAAANGSPAPLLPLETEFFLQRRRVVPAFIALKMEEMKKNYEGQAQVIKVCDALRKECAAIALAMENERLDRRPAR